MSDFPWRRIAQATGLRYVESELTGLGFCADGSVIGLVVSAPEGALMPAIMTPELSDLEDQGVETALPSAA